MLYGIPYGMRFFVALFDPIVNIGLAEDDMPGGMRSCDNCRCTPKRCLRKSHLSFCSVTHYDKHSQWSATLAERFSNELHPRNATLFYHIICNTLSIILVHIQVKTGTS